MVLFQTAQLIKLVSGQMIIIKKVNSTSVTEIKEIQKIIGMVRPGQNLSMDIQRNKSMIKVNVLVSKMNYESR